MKVVPILLCVAIVLAATEQPPPEQELTEVYTSDMEEELAAAQEPPPVKVEQVVREPEPVPQPQAAEPSPKVQDIVAPASTTPKYMYESFFVSLVFMFLLNYKTGKRTNEVIADRWVQSVMKIVKQQFALIGFGEDPAEQNQGIIVEESGHQYTFYATGRENLSLFEASFELRKREDLISYYALEFVFPEKDLVTIDIPMETTIPLVFCLAKKRELKALKEKCPDLNFLTKNFDVTGLNEPYRILGENSESVDFIFDGFVIKYLNQLSSIIHSIHFSDQKVFSNATGHLRLVLNANHNEPEKNEQAVKLALYIVDKIVAIKLPQNIREKAEKSRQAFAATKEKQELEKKQEELQKQKAEKRRLEEQRIRNLPPEKQQRALQKQKSKEMNKRLRGKVMKVM